MRSINKGAEPQELRNWKTANAGTPQNLIYGGGGFPAEQVRQALLLEQYHLCAYTMKALPTAADCTRNGVVDTTYSCHIEHLLPQSRKIAAETIDYQNMLACYPPSKSEVACEYGALRKANYDPAVHPFVSPLSPNAKQHFHFANDGSIKGLTADGEETIKVLKLDHPSLVNDRKAVIKGWLEPKKGKPLSASAARRLAGDICRPDQQNCLNPFCVAVAQTAIAHAIRLEGRAARMKQKPSYKDK